MPATGHSNDDEIQSPESSAEALISSDIDFFPDEPANLFNEEPAIIHGASSVDQDKAMIFANSSVDEEVVPNETSTVNEDESVYGKLYVDNDDSMIFEMSSTDEESETSSPDEDESVFEKLYVDDEESSETSSADEDESVSEKLYVNDEEPSETSSVGDESETSSFEDQSVLFEMSPVDGESVIHQVTSDDDDQSVIYRPYKEQLSRVPSFEVNEIAVDTFNQDNGNIYETLAFEEPSIGSSGFPISGHKNGFPSGILSDLPNNNAEVDYQRLLSSESTSSVDDSPSNGTNGIVGAPSIQTVEAAAQAKVFFETYYKNALERNESRAQRKTELELYLDSVHCGIEEKNQVMNNWLLQERNDLRDYRVLEMNSNAHNDRREILSTGRYQPIHILGEGTYGIVTLVREKEHIGNKDKNSELFAMKIMSKRHMLWRGQEGRVRAERDFLVASRNSRWIVPLVASFQDMNNLYLVTEYMTCGDFLGLLNEKRMLWEFEAKWYFAEIILCIEEVHKLGWIHRDVKPDNFLVSSSGHLKITDLGFAFDGRKDHNQAYYDQKRQSLLQKLNFNMEGDQIYRDKAWNRECVNNEGCNSDLEMDPCEKEDQHLPKSFVGSYSYMAPEVMMGTSYDARCDWWSVGVMLFQVCL